MRKAVQVVFLVGVMAALSAVTWSQSAARIVDNAAEALGGAERVRSTKNITLAGYGQYAAQLGGGNITASPDAPQKYVAANDLRRVYDLENDRFQQLERQNDLFPFMIATGHTFVLRNTVLDGDIAFNIADGTARRIARWSDGDGVHMRRMWMLNNPVALVRVMMDPETKLSAPKHEGSYTVVDITLKQGDKLGAGFSADHLPAWVRWSNPDVDLGEVTFATRFTGYGSFQGLLLPLGYDTRLDWRNVDYFKLYVDHYMIDDQIANLEAPAEVRNAPEPPSYPAPPAIKSVTVADHMWRISPSGTTVIEFRDHLTLFDLDTGSWQRAKAILAYARTLVPGKPITQLIVTHHHFDHSSGLRQAVAEGLTIISRRGNEGIFQEMVTHPDPDFPDELAMSPKPLKFIPVDEKLELSDDTMKLDVYWARNNIHMADAVFAYAPGQKVIMEGDIATAAWDYNFWPDTLRDAIDYYKLDPEKDSPVHSVWPEHPDVLTMEQVDELIKGGTQRGRELCAAHLAKGDYFAGCPIWSKRY